MSARAPGAGPGAAGPDPATVEAVVGRFRRMVEGDGARLEVAGVEGRTVRVRFVRELDPATGRPRCEACELAPDDLRVLLAEALALAAPTVEAVEVEAVELDAG